MVYKLNEAQKLVYLKLNLKVEEIEKEFKQKIKETRIFALKIAFTKLKFGFNSRTNRKDERKM